jgi:TPR repeat protein
MLTVGIDIGTSFSSISILDQDGKAQPVKVANGTGVFGDSYSMPSAVFIDQNGNILIGQLAVSARMKNPSCFKGEFKRDLGQQIPYNLGGLQLMPEDLYKEYFIHFKRCAEAAAGEKIGKAYITYPANFGKRKRELVEYAAKLAGLLEVELIDEPTAAALCYCSKGKINTGDKLLVYDFGGGTFDVALIEYDGEGFKPLTQALGIDQCGGIDIDRMIFRDILETFPKEILPSLEQNKMAKDRTYAQILELSIRAKHQLSTLDSFQEGIPVGFDFVDYELTRKKLNEYIAPMIEETLQQVQALVRNAGHKMSDIDTCVLVGGTCRIPYIQERLENLLGKPAYKDIDPELAVCMGATLFKKEKAISFEEAIAQYQSGKYEKAVNLFRILADQGNSEASLYLGRCYKEGFGVIADDKEAFDWFKISAEAGIAEAQYELGVCYLQGNGVTTDDQAAIQYIKKAANQNNVAAQYELGLLYEYGSGVEENPNLAVFWYEKAAAQGDQEADKKVKLLKAVSNVQVNEKKEDKTSAKKETSPIIDVKEGIRLYEDRKYEEAFRIFKAAAEQGYAEAQYRLGCCFRNGHGVSGDYKEAYKWYQKAAEQGNADAQNQMGEDHRLNYVEQVTWYRKAAEQGHAEAQYNLGRYYLTGMGLRFKDDKVAAEWYRKAAEQGHVEAMHALGKRYMIGMGVTQDYAEAIKWYRKGIEQGSACAQYELGECYYWGKGVTQDYAEAVKCYRKAAELGNDDAQKKLGDIYRDGKGVNKDKSEARKWYEKAANQGSPYAKKELNKIK